ncbi:MAG: hypothetical protein MJE77_09330 [Proteobacteria bacterium]|nr:hypothetical protein [Pseudomonadota bacterium]
MSIQRTARPARRSDYVHYAALFPELGVDDPVPEEELWVAIDTAQPGGCLAVARFSVRIFGAFPFRLTDPRLARPLIEAMVDKAADTARRTAILLNLEDDPELVAVLNNAGGRVEMETYHLSGPLPPAHEAKR